MSVRAFKDATITVLNAAVSGTPFNSENVDVEIFNGTGRVVIKQPFSGATAVPPATVTDVLDDLQAIVGLYTNEQTPAASFAGTFVGPVQFLDVRVETSQ